MIYINTLLWLYTFNLAKFYTLDLKTTEYKSLCFRSGEYCCILARQWMCLSAELASFLMGHKHDSCHFRWGLICLTNLPWCSLLLLTPQNIKVFLFFLGVSEWWKYLRAARLLLVRARHETVRVRRAYKDEKQPTRCACLGETGRGVCVAGLMDSIFHTHLFYWLTVRQKPLKPADARFVLALCTPGLTVAVSNRLALSTINTIEIEWLHAGLDFRLIF